MEEVDEWFDSEEYYNELDPEWEALTHLKYCTTGVFESLFPLLISILQFTFLQRIIFSFDNYLSRKTQDFLVGSLGIIFLLYRGVNNVSIIVSLCYFLFSFIFLRIFRTYTYLGPVFILISLASTVLCQLSLDSGLFMSFRGSWMVMTMKMVSLSFDIHEREFENVGFAEMFGYVFNPSTYFFGLFTSFKKYKEVKGFISFQEDYHTVLLSAGFLGISSFSVLYSDCLLEMMPTDFPIFNDFKNAQSFRFGHYFVNYFLWSTALLGGFVAKNLKIVDAAKIEFPRSMDEIVSFWNIPMHEFLHKYIYTKTRRFSQFFGIFMTFLTSALLHGLNFQISAVLISLGLFAYSEAMFRNRLAHNLNLCVKSRPCQKCAHKTPKNNWTKMATLAINSFFIVANVILLIYLGMPFDNSETAQFGYSMNHTLNYWWKWKFIGHIFSAILLVLGFCF